MTSEDELSVGVLAHLAGTTVRTVRHYEHIGLLEPGARSAGGHRRYHHTHVRRLLHVLALRDLGVPLERIRPIADGQDPQALLEVLQRHRGDIEAQRKLLTATLTRIDQLTQRARAADGSGTTERSPELSPSAALDLLEGLAMSIALTRIYTRTGDGGTTGLGSNDRVPKTDARIEVIGAVDELTAAVGMVLAEAPTDAASDVLWRIQNELFDVGADVAVPIPDDELAAGSTTVRLTAEYVARLEHDCDQFNADLPPLRSFVLPGASAGSARLHFARAVCRRAERRAWHLEDVNQHVRLYLNRLSDLLFILARTAETAPEPLWSPAGTTTRAATPPAGSVACRIVEFGF